MGRYKLKPCPFCGCDETLNLSTLVVSVKYAVRCGDCRAQTRWFDRAASATRAWNRRAA